MKHAATPPPDPSVTSLGPAAHEPAIVRGAVLAFLGLLGLIGLVQLDEQTRQTVATYAVGIMPLIPLLQAWWTRRVVYSPATAGQLLNAPPPLEYADHDHGTPDDPAVVSLDQALEQAEREAGYLDLRLAITLLCVAVLITIGLGFAAAA